MLPGMTVFCICNCHNAADTHCHNSMLSFLPAQPHGRLSLTCTALPPHLVQVRRFAAALREGIEARRGGGGGSIARARGSCKQS